VRSRNSSTRARSCTLVSPKPERRRSAVRTPCSPSQRSRASTRCGSANQTQWRPGHLPRVGHRLRSLGSARRGLPDRQDRPRTRFDATTDKRATFPRWTPENLRANQPFVDLLTRWAKAKNATPAQIALAWLLAQKPFIVPIPGTRSVEHLNENLGALDINLTPAEVQQISTESGSLQVYGERMDADNMALVE
jgi:hypothetical protein